MMPKSGRSFLPVMPELAQDRKVVAPDYFGYGESDSFAKDVTPSINDYADSIIDVINHFDFPCVDLVGYHTGSMVAVNVAYRLPSKVGKIINLSAPIFSVNEIKEFNAYYSPTPLDEAGTRFSKMWQRILHYRGPNMTLEMAAESLAENLRAGERYEDGHRAAFDYSFQYVEQLQQIEQPLLVMNFGDDLFEHTKRVDKYLNNGQRIDFPTWGHGALAVQTKQVAQTILNFLK